MLAEAFEHVQKRQLGGREDGRQDLAQASRPVLEWDHELILSETSRTIAAVPMREHVERVREFLIVAELRSARLDLLQQRVDRANAKAIERQRRQIEGHGERGWPGNAQRLERQSRGQLV